MYVEEHILVFNQSLIFIRNFSNDEFICSSLMKIQSPPIELQNPLLQHCDIFLSIGENL